MCPCARANDRSRRKNELIPSQLLFYGVIIINRFSLHVYCIVVSIHNTKTGKLNNDEEVSPMVTIKYYDKLHKHDHMYMYLCMYLEVNWPQ